MKQMWKIPLLLLTCFLLPVNTDAAITANDANDTAIFDVQQANKQFNSIVKGLSINKMDLKSLNAAIHELEDLADDAAYCVQNLNKKITSIESQIKQYYGSDEKKRNGVDADYLQNQKMDLEKKLAQCRLLQIQAEEAIDLYQKNILELQQEITFTRGETIWQSLQSLPADWNALSLADLKKEEFQPHELTLYYLIPVFLLSIAIGWWIKRIINQPKRSNLFLFIVNVILIFLGLTFIIIFLIWPSPFQDMANNVVYQNILFEFSLYLFSILALHFLFLHRRIPILLYWYGFDVTFFKYLIFTFISIYFFRKIGLNIFTLYQASETLLLLFESIMLFISLAAMLYFTYRFYRCHPALFSRLKHPALFYQLIILAAVSLLALDYIGYTFLAINTAHFIFALLMISALGGLLLYGINRFYQMINYTPSYHMQLKKLLGYVTEPPFFELYVLKILAQITVILLLIYLFALVISEVSYFIEYFFDYFINGFHIGSFHIKPMQWLIGIFILCSLILISRRIAAKVSSAQQYDEEEETQVALASIILYAGVSLSIIISLLIAGFSFTSLAIIAGALSVGIGLGLQSIVNNFFSGLILLIERPIKAGDRIKIDNIEGFVKKVRVRSTQIMTPTQEDIIIPNSDLITHQVTNFMFSDTSWRVKIPVGVAYGSDTELVFKLLMQIAMEHPEVIKKKNKKPMVLFRSFGDNALIFEVWCLIKNVNNKYYVASELHFAIDKAFREHNITIAFPQMDIHIKEAPVNKKHNKDK